MIRFSKFNLFWKVLINAPIIVLFVSVLNEFDFNYLGLKYFSFNFPFILIFFWSLKKTESLGYGLIFIAGIFNDVVIGFPIGISSFSYLVICGFASYLRNITLRPSLLKDWAFFLLAILVVNSIIDLILFIFFLMEPDYVNLLVNILFTFLFYILFAYIFKAYEKIAFEKKND